MKVNIKEIQGNWHLGYTLDKHVLSSTPVGENEQGHMQFDTVRSEVGEAVYRLKYKGDITQAPVLAQAIYANLIPLFDKVDVIIPMAASTQRAVQPVPAVVAQLAQLTGADWYGEWLQKAPGGKSLKDLQGREAREGALAGALSLNGDLQGSGKVNVLVVDDLYQTGASIEAACAVIGSYARIDKIFVAALTRKY